MTIQIKEATAYTNEELILPMADLIASGFKDKFTHKLFSESDIIQISLVISQILCFQHKKNILIAEKENQICGCLYFLKKTDNKLNIRKEFKKVFPVLKRLKIFLQLGFFTHSPKTGETYIDFLSVLPNFSRIGVAHNLLSYCQKLNNKNKLTLYVASKNIAAYNLYKKSQFNTVKSTSSNIGNWLTGVKTWYFMEWSQ